MTTNLRHIKHFSQINLSSKRSPALDNPSGGSVCREKATLTTSDFKIPSALCGTPSTLVPPIPYRRDLNQHKPSVHWLLYSIIIKFSQSGPPQQCRACERCPVKSIFLWLCHKWNNCVTIAWVHKQPRNKQQHCEYLCDLWQLETALTCFQPIDENTKWKCNVARCDAC